VRSALEAAVGAGNDTDTVAAIAGSLLGARWGATALPLSWRRLVHGRRVYGEPTLRVADLERLARLAFGGGQTDRAGWPSVTTMLPYYAREWPASPRVVDIGGVALGNVAALSAALDAGTDTVISLCRMGTQDVPTQVEHHVLGLLDTNAEENPNVALLLGDTADGLHTMVAEGRRVFVHCVQAENRTPALAAAWLHRHDGLTAAAALEVAARELNRPKAFLAEAVHALASDR
jgi:hypothetical protein